MNVKLTFFNCHFPACNISPFSPYWCTVTAIAFACVHLDFWLIDCYFECTDNSQGSIATHLRCGENFMIIITNFQLILTVKKVWKLVNLGWSYKAYKNGQFFGPPCSLYKANYLGLYCSKTKRSVKDFLVHALLWQRQHRNRLNAIYYPKILFLVNMKPFTLSKLAT